MSYALNHCGNKVVYYTKTQARKARDLERRKYANKKYFYQCQFCGWWHLSKSNHKRKKYIVEGEVFWR